MLQLQTHYAKGLSLRTALQRPAVDAWAAEVLDWLTTAVSESEGKKFRLLTDQLMWREIPATVTNYLDARLWYLDALREQITAGLFDRGEAVIATPIKLFISHAHTDKELAGAFVDFVRECINLPPHAIRCTSVAGYKLETGSDGAEVLRGELRGAICAVALLTATSVEGAWPLFELGARWVNHLHVAPLLHPSLDFKMLPGPLAGRMAHKVDDPAGMLQLIEELSGKLQIPQSNSGVVHRAFGKWKRTVDALITVHTRRNANLVPPPQSEPGVAGPKRRATKGRDDLGVAPSNPKRQQRERILELLQSGARPQVAAEGIAALCEPASMIATVLKVQSDFLMDCSQPSALAEFAFPDAPEPYDHLIRVVAHLCEGLDDKGKDAICDSAEALIRHRRAKGTVAEWNYRLSMRVLAAEVQRVFGIEAQWVAHRILGPWVRVDGIESALHDLLPPVESERRPRAKR